jgi:hypothetical protein
MNGNATGKQSEQQRQRSAATPAHKSIAHLAPCAGANCGCTATVGGRMDRYKNAAGIPPGSILLN